MPAQTDPGEPKVIVVADAATQRCAVVCRALGAVGIEVIRVPDVYAALGELAADHSSAPLAAVVQVTCIDNAETEFFPLANRLVRGGTFVFAEADSRDAALGAALAAGAKKLDMADLSEWAEALADLPVATRADKIAKPPSPETREAIEPPQPESVAGEPPQDEPVEVAVPDIAPVAEIAHDEPPAPLEPPADDPEPQADAPGMESRPTPSADMRVARPIAVPGEWRLPPLPHNGGDRAEEDGPAPAVPWRPQANRPTRTPPSARAVAPSTPEHPGGVELTREEIDALLDRPADGPESGRRQR